MNPVCFISAFICELLEQMVVGAIYLTILIILLLLVRIEGNYDIHSIGSYASVALLSNKEQRSLLNDLVDSSRRFVLVHSLILSVKPASIQ